jgi:hypothetical protein
MSRLVMPTMAGYAFANPPYAPGLLFVMSASASKAGVGAGRSSTTANDPKLIDLDQWAGRVAPFQLGVTDQRW